MIGVVVGLVLTLTGLRLHQKWKVHQAIAGLRHSGLPTRYEDLLRREGIIRGASNMVTEITNAVGSLPDLDEKTRKLLPVMGLNKSPTAGEGWPENVLTVTKSYLTENRKCLDRLQAAVKITNAWYWETYDPERWNISTIVAAKRAANLFALDAEFRAAKGQLDAAADSTDSIFRLADSMYQDPILITHLVRAAIVNIGVNQLEYLLSYGAPGRDGVGAMREALKLQISQTSLSHVYAGEFVFFLEPAFYGKGRMFFGDAMEPIVPGTWVDYWQRVRVAAYRMSGLADQDILYAVDVYREIESRAGGSLKEQAALEKGWSDLLPGKRGLSFRYWSETTLKSGASLLKRSLLGHSRLRAADAALAVVQYRLDHGSRMPESLKDLVPEYLESVPIEPRSGEPFELIKTADGFCVGRSTPVFKVRK